MKNKIKSVTVSYPDDEHKEEFDIRLHRVLAKIIVNMPPERLQKLGKLLDK